MAKALLIAEKPSLMRNIQTVYNNHRNEFSDQIDFQTQAGHIVELIDPAEYDEIYKKWDIDLLPINPAKEGGWQYKVSPSTKEMFNNIKNAIKSKEYSYIIHAGDPDAEGELLINIALQKMNNTLPVKRFWTNAQDEQSVLDALKNLKDDSDDIYKNLYYKALVRQHADWLFGINGSRAVADKIGTWGQKIATGRVMTWVQTQIVNREDEINNFVPSTEYGVNSILRKNDNDFVVSLFDEDNQKAFYKTSEEAEEIIRKLTNEVKVISFTKKQEETQPPKLYKLATLQQAASKDGFTADRTLAVVQSLYEKKFLTYPRTDCEYLGSGDNIPALLNSSSAVSKCADFISDATANITKYKSNKRFVNDTELTKHGHSAIVPTTLKPNLDTLSPDEQKIYTMVATRFVASLLDPLVTDKSSVVVENNGYIFKGSGRTLVSPGFNALLKKSFSEEEIPEITPNEMLNVMKHTINEKTTKCPNRYTDGTLIAAMENPSKYFTDEALAKRVKGMSIGTPSTRDSIIKKLIADKYIARNKKGQLYPTDFGTYMIHKISHLSLCKTEMTGQWDEKLKDIQNGIVSPEEVEIYMMEQVEKLINDVKLMDKQTMPKKEEVEIGTCSCGNTIFKGDKRFHCKSCKKWMPKILSNAYFTDEEAISLFNNEKVKKRIRPKKMEFEKLFHLDMNAEFPLQGEDIVEESNIHCPKCNSLMKKSNNRLNCDCGLSVSCMMASVELDDNTINELFKNGRTSKKIEGFYSPKKHSHFSAYIKFEDDEFKFDFS